MPAPDAGDTESHVAPSVTVALHVYDAVLELNATVRVGNAVEDDDTGMTRPPGEAERDPGVFASPRSSTTGTTSVFRASALCTVTYPTYLPADIPVVFTAAVNVPGVLPEPPLRVSQLAPEVAVKETPDPVLVVTEIAWLANWLPACPRNSSVGTEVIRSGRLVTLRITDTVAGETGFVPPGTPANEMVPKYCPAVSPEGSIRARRIDGVAPIALDVKESQLEPEPVLAVHPRIPDPLLPISTDRAIGVVDPAITLTTIAPGASVSWAGAGGCTLSTTGIVCC